MVRQLTWESQYSKLFMKVITVYLRRVSVMDEDEDQLDASVTEKHCIGKYCSRPYSTLELDARKNVEYGASTMITWKCLRRLLLAHETRAFHQCRLSESLVTDPLYSTPQPWLCNPTIHPPPLLTPRANKPPSECIPVNLDW